MIKDKEVAMVHAASYALDYLNEKYSADAEEIIKKFLKEFNSFEMKPELKIYSVAAISEILKMKFANKTKTKKQLIQMFVNKNQEFLQKIEEASED